MADRWDFSEYTDAELATLATNIKAKLNSLLTGSKTGSLDGASFSEFNIDDLRSLQSAVNAEQRARGVTFDDELIGVEFEEASE